MMKRSLLRAALMASALFAGTLVLPACKRDDPQAAAQAAAAQQAEKERLAEVGAKQFDDAVSAQDWRMARSYGEILQVEHPTSAAAARIKPKLEEIKVNAEAEQQKQRRQGSQHPGGVAGLRCLSGQFGADSGAVAHSAGDAVERVGGAATVAGRHAQRCDQQRPLLRPAGPEDGEGIVDRFAPAKPCAQGHQVGAQRLGRGRGPGDRLGQRRSRTQLRSQPLGQLTNSSLFAIRLSGCGPLISAPETLNAPGCGADGAMGTDRSAAAQPTGHERDGGRRRSSHQHRHRP